MAKEELEKEAEKWCVENMDCCRSENCAGKDIPYFDEEERCVAKSAYVASAEPREKRIAVLEAQIEKMKCCGNCIHCYEGAYHNGYRCKDHARESVCDNWEMMSDEVRKEMLEDD